MAPRGPNVEETAQIAFVDVATGDTRVVAGERSVDVGGRWARDGSLLYVSDADGWFQVVRLTADGHDRIVLTSGEREHGDPSGGAGSAPLPSPDGSRFVHVEVHDGLAGPGRRRPRGGRGTTPRPGTPAEDAPDRHGGDRGQPDQPVGRRLEVGRLAGRRGVDRRHRRTRDRAGRPVAAAGARRRRGRRATAPGHRLAAGRPARRALAVARAGRRARRRHGPRRAPDRGHRSGARTPRPASAAGRRVPTIVYPHGGPTGQSFRSFQPFKQLLVAEGFAFFDVDFRGSTGYGRAFRLANHDEWGHADVHDLVDAARWAAEQPWSDGRLAIYGGSYGGYLVLCALVEEPALWRAGVDLYGDSEIAESYPPRRPARPARPPQDDGLARRPGPDRRLPARLAGLSGGADRGAAADPPRAQGQARRPAHDRADGRGARDRGQALRGPLVRRGGPRLGEAREPARRLRAHPRVPQDATSSTSRRSSGRASPARSSPPRPRR